MDRRKRTKTVAKLCAAIAVATLATGPARAEQVKLDVAMGTPVVLSAQKQTAYLRVAMTGFEMDDPSRRTPVNVAIVLDKSGSMRGEKIAEAKQAAIMAVNRLRADDIVSVVAYDSTVQVLVPATKVSDRNRIISAIRRLEAGGRTALFAGVSKGAREVRKFLEEHRVNRVILLSDGLANVGPSSPGDLGELGSSLIREGISVTTIGLGLDYNEDLMTQLADTSDGNHMFAETARDLARTFDQEFGDVLSVVAQNVTVTINCVPGVRPVRVLERDANIVGQSVTTTLNQLYGRQMKYVVLEMELPPGRAGEEMRVASVDVSYANMATKTTDKLGSAVSVRFTDMPSLVESNTNPDVMVAAAHQIGVETNRIAVKLRDEGKVGEARQVLKSNAAYLFDNATKYNSPVLEDYSGSNFEAAERLDEASWKKQRKVMKEEQHAIKTQQRSR